MPDLILPLPLRPTVGAPALWIPGCAHASPRLLPSSSRGLRVLLGLTWPPLGLCLRAVQEEEEEEGEESGPRASECSREQLKIINSTQACRVLVDPQGPFAACHQTVAPEPFQE